MKSLYTPPQPVRSLFKNYRWVTSNQKILLTIDDGPNNISTEAIMRKLESHHVTAIFFCIGNKVLENKSLIESLIQNRHVIGNHSFDHNNILIHSAGKLYANLEKLNAVLYNEFGYDTTYFRPPYGRLPVFGKSILNKLQMTGVMWSLFTYDYKNNYKIVKFAAKKLLEQNSIIVLHDKKESIQNTCDAIDLIVETALERNYEIGEPVECLK